MDVLAIILACSLHPDDVLVRTLVDVQSGDSALFVGDLSTLTMNDGLQTTTDALRFVEQVRRRGGRPAVGLLGIPIHWARRYDLREADLFDACTNIAVGTAALSEYHDRCTGQPWRRPKMSPGRSRPGPRNHPPNRSAMYIARTCVLARFAADLGVTGAPKAILKALARGGRGQHAHDDDALPERSAILGAETPSRTDVSSSADDSHLPTTSNRSAPGRAPANAANVPRTRVPAVARE